MRWLRSCALGAAILLAFAAMSLVPSNAAAATEATRCVVDGSGGTFGNTQGVIVEGKCVPVDTVIDDDGHSGPPTKTVSCGRHIPGGAWNPECGAKIMECYDVKPGQGNVQTNAFATLTKIGGKWTRPVVWCPANVQPAVTMAAVRQRALRLLPHVRIGSAWKDSALVNAEVILWAGTGTDRSLGTVTIVGQQVALRIGFDHANWDFGDGDADTTTDPGKPYDHVHDPCRTAQCPHYYGHTYLRTGSMTITLTVTWHAQFSLDAGKDWTDIDPAISGPSDRHVIVVKQARGVLVPNPGD